MARVKFLTLEERKLIEKMLKENRSINWISSQLKRSYNGIATEVRINGGRDKYNAEAAEQRRRDVSGRITLSFLDRKIRELQEKFSVIEMQMDILTETIRSSLDEKNKKI